MPKELLAKDWIRAVRDAREITQAKLSEMISAEGDRTIAKWEGGVAEPRFKYTRRIALIAPWPLQLQLVGRSTESAPVSDPDRKVAPNSNGETIVDQELEAAMTLVRAELKALDDPGRRREATSKALDAIRAVRQNPSELDAGHRPGRVQRK